MPALHHPDELRKPRCLMLIALGVTCILLLILLLWLAMFISRLPNSRVRQSTPWRTGVALVETPPVRKVPELEA